MASKLISKTLISRTLIPGALALLLTSITSLNGEARNSKYYMPLDKVLNSKQAENVLIDKDIKLYFADQETPAIETKLEEIRSNRKTNSVGKSDKGGCEWAFLSVVKALQAKAKEMGADAIINITSDYGEEFSSKEEYECHAGATVTGVVLKGTPVIFKGSSKEITPAKEESNKTQNKKIK